MNRNLWLLAVLQGLFLTNNVTFIAINGLVGLSLAPYGWMATLPVMAYVVGGAICTGPVAWTQARFGRQTRCRLSAPIWRSQSSPSVPWCFWPPYASPPFPCARLEPPVGARFRRSWVNRSSLLLQARARWPTE